MSQDGERPLNRGYTFRAVVETSTPVGIVDYLAEHWPHSSPETWRARVEAGEVRLGPALATPDTVVRQGQELCWDRPPWREPQAPLDYRVIHKDEVLLAVDKPSGLPTLPGAGFLEHTLLLQVQAKYPEAAPLHRLGRYTSGLVLCARTAEARAALSRDWAARRVAKRYRTLAQGRAAQPAFPIDQPIGPVPYPPLGTVHAATAEGKPSRSMVRVVEQGAAAFLAEVDIETGRPHQVRIHLASAGHPLVGDPLYGPGGLPLPDTRAVPGDPGYLLHAAELRFAHPVSGKSTELKAPIPSRLQRVESG